MSIGTLIGLILSNVIWSAHPVMGKWVLADFPPIHAAWLRYCSAFVAYLLMRAVMAARMKDAVFLRSAPRKDMFFAVLLGLLPFGIGPLVQLNGLIDSRATDNAIIIAMEPLITVAMARLFLREHLSRSDLITFAIALTGFGLLSRWDQIGSLSATEKTALIGDLLLLISLLGESSYTIFARSLSVKYRPLPLFGTALLSAAIFLTTACLLSGRGLPDFSHFTWRSIVGVLWVGPLGTMLVYLYWMQVLAKVPVSAIAVTLFIQPVTGSAFGYLLLGERLDVVQAFGGALIFAAVIGQAATRRDKKTD